MNAPFSVRWTEDTGRFLLLAGLLYPAGAGAVESGRGNRRPGEEYGSARWGDPVSYTHLIRSELIICAAILRICVGHVKMV